MESSYLKIQEPFFQDLIQVGSKHGKAEIVSKERVYLNVKLTIFGNVLLGFTV